METSDVNARDFRWLDAITGRMIVEHATDLSDAEIERTLGRCVCGPALIEAAKRLRNFGLLAVDMLK